MAVKKSRGGGTTSAGADGVDRGVKRLVAAKLCERRLALGRQQLHRKHRGVGCCFRRGPWLLRPPRRRLRMVLRHTAIFAGSAISRPRCTLIAPPRPCPPRRRVRCTSTAASHRSPARDASANYHDLSAVPSEVLHGQSKPSQGPPPPPPSPSPPRPERAQKVQEEGKGAT
jgi:hypothetical protein